MSHPQNVQDDWNFSEEKKILHHDTESAELERFRIYSE